MVFFLNNNRNYTKTALISSCRKGRHNTKSVSYYGPNKVDQFRNIILKIAFLIIAKVTTNWVKKLCYIKLNDVMKHNVEVKRKFSLSTSRRNLKRAEVYLHFVWVCVYVGFVMCGYFGNMFIVFTVFCIVCTVFLYCFVYVYLFLFVTSVRTTATEWKLNCSK